MFNNDQYWQIPIPAVHKIRQYKVILDMKMSVEHISRANIGKTDRLLLLPKYRPTNNPIPKVYTPKTDIDNITGRVGYVHIVHTRTYSM